MAAELRSLQSREIVYIKSQFLSVSRVLILILGSKLLSVPEVLIIESEVLSVPCVVILKHSKILVSSGGVLEVVVCRRTVSVDYLIGQGRVCLIAALNCRVVWLVRISADVVLLGVPIP
jgi:hypothetical protein